MIPHGVGAINAFITEKRSAHSKTNNRLIIKKNELYFKKISRYKRFQARVGYGDRYGDASFKKIAEFTEKNRETLFPNSCPGQSVLAHAEFNAFIDRYSKNRTVCWKKNVKKISMIQAAANYSQIPYKLHVTDIRAEVMTPISPYVPPRKKEETVIPFVIPIEGLEIFDSISEEKKTMSAQVRHAKMQEAFDTCSATFEKFKLSPSTELLRELIIACKKLDRSICDLDGLTRQKHSESLCNQILNLKNQIRATCFPARDKRLKGPLPLPRPVTIPVEVQQKLKPVLKSIQQKILLDYFKDRLDRDKIQIALLTARLNDQCEQIREPPLPVNPAMDDAAIEKALNEHQENIDRLKIEKKKELTCLFDQIAKMDKKNKEGKPAAIPRWYHCTRTIQNMSKILPHHIHYASGGYPGVFTSTKPEHIPYGDPCFVLSDHIEYTGTHGEKGQWVPPLYAQREGNEKIMYTDTITDELIRKQANLKPQDNQEGVRFWIGWQVGKETLPFKDPLLKRGIPIQGERRCTTEFPLQEYFADTSLCYIIHRTNDALVKNLGKPYRFNAVPYKESEAFRALYRATFVFTLPTSLQGMKRFGEA